MICPNKVPMFITVNIHVITSAIHRHCLDTNFFPLIRDYLQSKTAMNTAFTRQRTFVSVCMWCWEWNQGPHTFKAPSPTKRIFKPHILCVFTVLL